MVALYYSWYLPFRFYRTILVNSSVTIVIDIISAYFGRARIYSSIIVIAITPGSNIICRCRASKNGKIIITKPVIICVRIIYILAILIY